MKMQNILKKTAMSAVMLSAVAAPAITHADNGPKTETTAVKIQAVAATLGGDDQSQKIVISKMTDPLELAKQYAPETVEDWQKTLEQFKKALVPADIKAVKIEKLSAADEAGETAGEFEPAVTMSKPVIKAIEVFKMEDAGEKPASLQAAVPMEKLTTAIKEVENGNVAFEAAIPAVKLNESSEDPKAVSKENAEFGTLAVTMVAAEAKEAAPAFPKAWDALAKAEESKDADAIRAALADLLKQFKQAIAAQEAAAK
ncbi:hypothetical protein RJP21_00965 [Paenibacillus sp. VCA1]|uniref:hypothetical protein n=1 Tax=Paenibacillus sp. VCA1 TaxID=3039148 RepID=UPI0028723A61|nr:hypothetical protein [Paenibacillus sp. VCA1]MDR9852165.1 hypothetical protein [Paenibacillus sp. VCA1]